MTQSLVSCPPLSTTPSAAAAARLLAAFRRTAATVPAYATLLAEQGVRPGDVGDVESFVRCCPLLTKRNTFQRFPIEQLSVNGQLVELADVLTSSGHGGVFSFGVSTRAQAAASAGFLDAAFDAAFDVRTRRTLAINCLPMGVVFSSHCMTVATTSVREDMATALVRTFGRHYDQLLLVGDPLFLKRLTDHAAAVGLEWDRYRVNVIVGEEIVGEHFRRYVGECLGLDPRRPERGWIMSSFGVGELGLHLCYETPATVALRRAAVANPDLAGELFGGDAARGASPMVFAYNPERTFIETVGADADGYGRLTVSMLDQTATIPLLRYQPGDIVRLLDAGTVAAAAARHGVQLPGALPSSLLALRGREREALPNGAHVAIYKDAVYADRRVADRLTGAVRLAFAGPQCTMHVQLTDGVAPAAPVEAALRAAVPEAWQPTRLVQWPYAAFPFGMRLDYERKFAHYAPDDRAPGALLPPW